MVLGMVGILLLAGTLLGKIGWGWGVLGAILLYWSATRFWTKYRAASNSIQARYTFDLLSKLDREKVLAAVSDIMLNAKHPSQDPENALKTMSPEQRYGFIALGMARIGIPPKIGGGWYEVRNPYAEILGAHREIAWVKKQIRLKYGTDVNFDDVGVLTSQTQVTHTSVGAARAKSTTTNDSGFSVLHDAAMAGDNNRAIQLLDSGEEVNVPVSKALKATKNDCEGATPLHFAVVNGCVDVAKSLLKRGANVRAVTEYDETPLHWAVGISDLIFEAMLSKGPTIGSEIIRAQHHFISVLRAYLIKGRAGEYYVTAMKISILAISIQIQKELRVCA